MNGGGTFATALIALSTSTPLLRQDAGRYFLAEDFARWLEERGSRSPDCEVDDGA